MKTLLEKSTPQIKSTKHPKKDQWEALKRIYLQYRPIFDLQQLRMKKLDEQDGKKRNLGYSKKAKREFHRWYVEYFGPDGEHEASPIIPSQAMFNEFRNYAYMLHSDKTIIGGARVFARKEKEGFTLVEYKKMSMIHRMKLPQRVVLSKEDVRFYKRNKELYLRIRGTVQIMKRQGVL